MSFDEVTTEDSHSSYKQVNQVTIQYITIIPTLSHFNKLSIKALCDSVRHLSQIRGSLTLMAIFHKRSWNNGNPDKS